MSLDDVKDQLSDLAPPDGGVVPEGDDPQGRHHPPAAPLTLPSMRGPGAVLAVLAVCVLGWLALVSTAEKMVAPDSGDRPRTRVGPGTWKDGPVIRLTPATTTTTAARWEARPDGCAPIRAFDICDRGDEEMITKRCAIAVAAGVVVAGCHVPGQAVHPAADAAVERIDRVFPRAGLPGDDPGSYCAVGFMVCDGQRTGGAHR